MSGIELLGYAASAAVLVTFCVNTMLPLRYLALGSNVLFSLYGLFDHLYPVLILHVLLFPINLARLIQIQHLIRDVRSASRSVISVEKLLPFMRRQRLRAGETLFRKGEIADRLYYIADGILDVSEIGVSCGKGDVVGEIGIFSPDHKRTATIVSRTDCEVYELSESKAKQVYFQDPSFGFAVLRLITTRLIRDSHGFAG
jgi:CRP/FNR family cyclic AMP-dependent transcriptional regulator